MFLWSFSVGKELLIALSMFVTLLLSKRLKALSVEGFASRLQTIFSTLVLNDYVQKFSNSNSVHNYKNTESISMKVSTHKEREGERETE